MIQQHPKKRIDIVIETLLIDRITELLDRMEISGYSVMPLSGGRGRGGSWSSDGEIGIATQMTALVCIVDASVVDIVLRDIFQVISQQIGFVTVSDVSVIRPERF